MASKSTRFAHNHAVNCGFLRRESALELFLWRAPFVEEHSMKMDILRDANYTYSFDRGLYFNRDAKKAFSFPFLDDHAEDEVLRSIHERTDGSAWKFYFNFPPSERVKREIESTLSEETDKRFAGAHSAS
jgi:hypothetical protein